LEWIGKDKWQMWTAVDLQGIDQDFVRSVFKQLRCGSEDYEWDLFALAFEAVLSIKRYISSRVCVGSTYSGFTAL
jgi:hypothetical protein